MSSKRSDTRRRLLTAARELIEGGHYSVGLGEIGRRAGVSRQAVYLHFASRAELLTALTSFIEEEADLHQLLAPVYAAASGVEALRHLIDAGAQFEPQIHAMVQAALRMQDDPIVDELSRQRMRTRLAAMRVVIARIEAEGQLATGWDVETATAFLWSLTASSTFDMLVVQHGWAPRKWAESTFRLLTDAFVTPPPPASVGQGSTRTSRALTEPPT
jgi:AcrR family transcriptional regulator